MPPFKTPKIAILILAAGSSKRMGSPKQLLPWGGTTLLGHSIAQAEKSDAGSVFIIIGANAEKIKETTQRTSATMLTNNEWRSGLGSSIVYGVQHLLMSTTNIDGILIMLADQPQVDTAYLNGLIELFHSEQKQIIASSYKDELGVPAIFDKTYFDELSVLQGDNGAKSVIHKNVTYVTSFSPNKSIVDIDTKKTYTQLYKESFKNQ